MADGSPMPGAAWPRSPLVRSVLHNLAVTGVSLVVGLIGVGIDRLLGIPEFASTPWFIAGVLLLTIGFLIRVWAAYHFYQNGMRVIVTEAQRTLLTTGPYRYPATRFTLAATCSCSWAPD